MRDIKKMNADTLRALAAKGEDSQRQFKADITHAESLAAEMAALANSEGGTILIGVADDHDRSLFIATVHRKPVGELDLIVDSSEKPEKTQRKGREIVGEMSGKPQNSRTKKVSSEKTSEKIIAALETDGHLSIAELSTMIGVTTRSIERNIQNLQRQGRFRRVGPDKGGRWEVIK